MVTQRPFLSYANLISFHRWRLCCLNFNKAPLSSNVKKCRYYKQQVTSQRVFARCPARRAPGEGAAIQRCFVRKCRRFAGRQ